MTPFLLPLVVLVLALAVLILFQFRRAALLRRAARLGNADAGKQQRWLSLSIILLLILMAVQLFILPHASRQANDDAANGQSLPGIYMRYQGRIYMNIPFHGSYVVPGADAASFGPLGDLDSGNLGKDRNAVYCGSRAIPQLRPEQVRFVQNSYVSDGTRAWYCTEEKSNPSYHWWQVFTRNGDEDSPEKPREKDYALVRLNPVNAAALKILIGAYAQDGEHAFYEGSTIPGADGASFHEVTRGWGDFTGREDENYTRDDNHVYFHGQVLPKAHPATFYTLEPDGGGDVHYGQDRSTGQFYIGARPFPAKVDGVDSSGLRLLIADGDRANHEIFYNASGLWYWDHQDDAFKRGCANPFHAAGMPDGAPAELSPGVWADGHDTFVLRAGDPSLRTRTTQLWMLAGLSRAQWSKVADISDKSSIGTAGSLWKAGGRLYFASASGQSQFFDDALYPVQNLAGLKHDIVSDDHPDPYSERLKVLDASDLQRFDSSDATIVCRMTSRYPGLLEFWK